MTINDRSEITAEDIEAVSEKLTTLYQSLPHGEQYVLNWLFSRAGQASDDVQGYQEEFVQPRALIGLNQALGLGGGVFNPGATFAIKQGSR